MTLTSLDFAVQGTINFTSVAIAYFLIRRRRRKSESRLGQSVKGVASQLHKKKNWDPPST